MLGVIVAHGEDEFRPQQQGDAVTSTKSAPVAWHIAVYCQNEDDRLAACLAGIYHATEGIRVAVTVLVNGSTDGSAAIAHAWTERDRTGAFDVSVVETAHADKSEAINRFFYELRRPAEFYFGIDGFTIVEPDALKTMVVALREDGHAHAASGYCTNGRTELGVGGPGALRGCFYALRGSFVQMIVSRNIRLPLGLYRGDGLLGSMVAHSLDPVRKRWDNARALQVAGARYSIRQLSVVKPSDLRRQFRRRVRQARGVLENAAIKEIIYRRGFEGLPSNADVMIDQYLLILPVPKVGLAQLPFMALAVSHVRRAIARMRAA